MIPTAFRPETPRFLQWEQILALLDGAWRAENARDHNLLASMYLLGLRVGEAVRLRACHFDWEAKQVKVPTLRRRLDEKTRSRYEVDGLSGLPLLPVPILSYEAVLRAIWRWGQHRTWIFPGANPSHFLGERAASGIFKRWARAAGLDPRVSSHALRHTAASFLYEKTKDVVLVSQFLRHADVTTTSRTYGFVDWSKAEGGLDV